MTVLFLHAFPFDPRMWERERAAVPGSEAPRLYELGDSMDEWADALLARYEGELVLVGASMGGYTAYHVARRAPERVRALLTVGARPQGDTAAGRARRDELIRVVREQGLGALWEALRPQAYAPSASEEVLAEGRGWVLEQDPDDVVRALAALRDRRDTAETLSRLDGRALVVRGDLDEIARAVDFEGVLPAERIRVVAGAGHLPNLERPDLFEPILKEFVWER